jgi:hypothetical protein
MWRSWCLSLALILSFSSFTHANEEDEKPSLAELARRTEEAKRSNTAEVRLITNADLASMSSGRVSSGKAPVRQKVRRRQDADEATIEDWQLAFDDARERLVIVVNQIRVLQLRLHMLRAGMYQAGGHFGRMNLGALVDVTFVELREAYQDESDLRDEIEQLRKDAFRSGLTWRKIDELTGELPESPTDYLPEDLD